MLEELGAPHLGHDDVSDHQVNRSVVLFSDEQRVFAILGFEDMVAASAKTATNDVAHRGLILDDEDRLIAAVFPGRHRRIVAPLRHVHGRRQENPDGGPVTGPRYKGTSTAMLVDHPI